MIYRRLILVSLSIILGVSVANAEWDWVNEKKSQKFFPAVGNDKYESSTYVMAVGTAEKLQKVNALDVEWALRDGKEVRFKFVDIQGDFILPPNIEIKKPIYFIDATFSGEVSFGVLGALRERQMIAMDWQLIEKEALQDINWITVTLSEKAYFRGVTFSKGASFFATTFSKDVDFSHAEFLAKADFSNAEFLKKVDFTYAVFSEARFTSANFLDEEIEVSFKGTRFSKRADFSFATLEKVNFNSAKNEIPLYIESNNDMRSDLNNGKIPKKLEAAFQKNKWALSEEVTVSIIEKGNQWLITNATEKHTYAVFKRRIYEVEQLVVYLKERRAVIETFNLVGCNYKKMEIDPESIVKYDFDESAFSRLIKNQQDIGRPFEAVYLTMKRYQRSQKNIVSRGIELVLFDWTTQYGTAKFPPWGLIAYAIICICFFSILYLFNRDFLIFVKTDGTIDETKKRPSNLEVFWFSLNTFIPAIELFNARNWQPKYGIKFCNIRFSTLATIERFLGWAMIPSLLGYFRL